VYEGLKELSAQHIIHYVPAKKVPVIYYPREREDIKYLNLPRSVYTDRLTRLQERVKNVINYGISTDTCRSKLLLEYFGEKSAGNCGHCDVCLAKKQQEQKSRARFEADV
jgi:ATP-dependent DNA helicase RecQ